MIAEFNKYALPGYYICCQCGKSIKHEGIVKMKRCDKCKGTQFIFTDNEKKDLK